MGAMLVRIEVIEVVLTLVIAIAMPTRCETWDVNDIYAAYWNLRALKRYSLLCFLVQDVTLFHPSIILIGYNSLFSYNIVRIILRFKDGSDR